MDIAGLESALCALAGVHDARVLRRQRDDEADDLIAFVVPAASGMSSDAIRRELCDVVSSPVLPRVVILDHLPLSPSGKISRAQLLDLAAEPIDQRPSAGPRDQMEREVADIWKSVLSEGDIGIHDDFFARGGDSLQALRLMAALEAHYAIRLSPKLLWSFPRLRKWQNISERRTPPCPTRRSSWSKPKATERRSTSCMAIGGEASTASDSPRTSERASILCRSPVSLARTKDVSMQEMATEHLAVIRRRTPQGPYFLGGYCIGGMLAAEIARQLVEQGEKIVGLFLIDPARSGTPWLRFVWPLIDHVGDVLKWNFRKKLDSMEFCGMAVVRWYRKSALGKFASGWRRSNSQKLKTPSSTVSEMDESDAEFVNSADYAVYVHAYRTYRLKRVLVPTTVYIPEEGSPPPPSWTRHIRKMFPMVSFQGIPGDHRTCITQHSEVLGAQLKKALGALSQQVP